MSRNWVSVVLLLWAFAATLLLFRRQVSDCIAPKASQRESGKETDVNPALVFDEMSSPVKNVKNNLNPSLSDHDRLSSAHERVSDLKPHLARYVSQIFHQQSVLYEKENFTMIMLTYKRMKVLPRLLLHYCKAKRLHKILVIWNDVGTPIPSNILNLVNECEVILQFIREKENKLTNRFKPRAEIETECKSLITTLAVSIPSLNIVLLPVSIILFQ